ncbi:MAG: hypothetical protein V3V78_05160 [Candidatus Woesearchaeota archaeon]
MLNEVACHKGKCWEVKENDWSKPAKSNYFEDLFEKDNIVNQIEKDLWRNYF